VVPALANIGAMSALADGMEIERAGQALEIVVILANGRACPEPFRLGSRNAPHRLNLNEFHHDSIVAAPQWSRIKHRVL
jgi:hypothetical protein